VYQELVMQAIYRTGIDELSINFSANDTGVLILTFGNISDIIITNKTKGKHHAKSSSGCR